MVSYWYVLAYLNTNVCMKLESQVYRIHQNPLVIHNKAVKYAAFGLKAFSNSVCSEHCLLGYNAVQSGTSLQKE
jgi:hypothetical protein